MHMHHPPRYPLPLVVSLPFDGLPSGLHFVSRQSRDVEGSLRVEDRAVSKVEPSNGRIYQGRGIYKVPSPLVGEG